MEFTKEYACRSFSFFFKTSCIQYRKIKQLGVGKKIRKMLPEKKVYFPGWPTSG